MATVPTLPTSTRIQFLNEGAANVVYRISVPPPTPEPAALEEYESGTPPPTEYQTLPSARLDHSIFENKLLRLRKDLPTTIPTIQSQANWEKNIIPLFPRDHLVDQTLILIPPSLISQLNAGLRTLESTPGLRRSKRHHTYLAADPYGLLVTDMTPTSPHQTIEFKPKWLLQSHSAPPNSIRCRQCAQNASKNSRLPPNEHYPLYCPMDFFSRDPKTVSNLAASLLSPSPSLPSPSPSTPNTTPAIKKQFIHWLLHNPLLPKLRLLQERLQRESITAWTTQSGPELETLCRLMTVRDCTVFLRFKVEEGDVDVEARIGDLDLKTERKLGYWRSVQEELVEGGWYQGAEAAERRQPNICAFNRKQ